jgi:hypothetical protein
MQNMIKVLGPHRAAQINLEVTVTPPSPPNAGATEQDLQQSSPEHDDRMMEVAVENHLIQRDVRGCGIDVHSQMLCKKKR